jgi:hypothetical protein
MCSAGYVESVAFAIRGKENVIVARMDQGYEIWIDFYMGPALSKCSLAEILEPAFGTFDGVEVRCDPSG